MGDQTLIEADLLARMMPLLQRAGRLTGTDLILETRAVLTVRDLAHGLACDPPKRVCANVVMNVLYPNEDPPMSWWVTAAGRAVAESIGYHRNRVPVLQAAAVLQVSRTRVYQLMTEGLLERDILGRLAVTVTSLRDEMANRRARARVATRMRGR